MYFKAGVLEDLEKARQAALNERAVRIQATVRCWRAQRLYERARLGIVATQSLVRKWSAVCAFQRTRRDVTLVQTRWRGRVAYRVVVLMRRNAGAKRIQTRERSRVQARRFQKQRAAAVRVQSLQRLIMARRSFLAALQEKREQAKMENKLAALQQKLQEAERAQQMLATQMLEQQNEHQAQLSTAVEQASTTSQPPPPPQPSSPSVSADLESLNSQLAAQRAENAKLSENNTEVLQVLASLQADNAKLREQNEALKNENATLKKQSADLKKSADSLGAKAKAQTAENETLAKSLAQAKAQMAAQAEAHTKAQAAAAAAAPGMRNWFPADGAPGEVAVSAEGTPVPGNPLQRLLGAGNSSNRGAHGGGSARRLSRPVEVDAGTRRGALTVPRPRSHFWQASRDRRARSTPRARDGTVAPSRPNARP